MDEREPDIAEDRTMAAKAKPQDSEFIQLIKDFHEGRAGRAEVARAIHIHTTSIGLRWLLESLQALVPGSKVACREAEVDIRFMCATQPRLQKAKYELVRLLFDKPETFDTCNQQFFKESPVCVMHIGGGRYAVLDGHHRVRRFGELFGTGRVMPVMLIWTDSESLLERFRQEVEEVKQAAGTGDVREIPLI